LVQTPDEQSESALQDWPLVQLGEQLGFAQRPLVQAVPEGQVDPEHSFKQ
jgi:hypothetical protein